MKPSTTKDNQFLADGITRLTALAKLLYLHNGVGLDVVAKTTNVHCLVFCFSGHWVAKGDTQGEHSWASEAINSRYDECTTFPPLFLYGEEDRKRNQLGVNLLHAAMRGCNSSRDNNSLLWVAPYYKSLRGFTTTNDVVARVNDAGLSLADAMIAHWIPRKAGETPPKRPSTTRPARGSISNG